MTFFKKLQPTKKHLTIEHRNEALENSKHNRNDTVQKLFLNTAHGQQQNSPPTGMFMAARAQIEGLSLANQLLDIWT